MKWMVALSTALIALVAVITGCGVAGTVGNASSHAAMTSSPTSVRGGRSRIYYIAADEAAWNYAPSGGDLITGKPLGPAEDTWTRRGPDRIGHVYRKALYREYTDGTFKHLKLRGSRWRHLGLLGPVIHAEVGDT